MSSLDDVLKGEASRQFSEAVRPDEVEREAAAAPVEAKPATGENEAQSAEPTGETPDAPTGQKLVPLPALQEERRKRQELQARLEELERRVVQQAAPQPQREKWEWTEDKVLNDLPKAFTTVEQRMERMIEERLAANKYDVSEATARNLYKDYDDVMAQYVEVARATPGLSQIVDASPMPGLTAYDAVKKHVEQKTANDPTKMESEVQRRVQEELSKMRGVIAADNAPKSITSARGSGAATPPGPAWSGPPQLDDIFRRK